MLRKTRDLEGARLGAQDGEIGHLKDLYFDDQSWTVRYLVADTGTWLPGKRVLLAPSVIKSIHFAAHRVIEVNLTKTEIESSPSMEAHQPVAQQLESEYRRFCGWPDYWVGPLSWGPMVLPGTEAHVLPGSATPGNRSTETEDTHLQSTEQVTGYAIQALDQHFGHIEQFIIDDTDWVIRYLVADLRNWLPGKRVLLAPQWISSVNWLESRIYIDFDRATVKRSPEYDPALPISRQYETKLFEHYNQKPYWTRSAEITLTS